MGRLPSTHRVISYYNSNLSNTQVSGFISHISLYLACFRPKIVRGDPSGYGVSMGMTHNVIMRLWVGGTLICLKFLGGFIDVVGAGGICRRNYDAACRVRRDACAVIGARVSWMALLAYLIPILDQSRGHE